MRTKRITAWLLVLALLLSLCMTTAFAAGGDYTAGLAVTKVDESKLSVSVQVGPTGASTTIQGVQSFVLAYDTSVLKALFRNGSTEVTGLTTMPVEKNMAYEVYLDDAFNEWTTKVYPYLSGDGKTGFLLIQPANGAGSTLTETVTLASVYLGFQTGKDYGDVTAQTVRFATSAELAGKSENKAVKFNDGIYGQPYVWSNGGDGDTLFTAPEAKPQVIPTGFAFHQAALEGTVTITGTPKIGETLTADTSGITSAAPGALTFQWHYEGSAEALGSGETYTPSAAADVGKGIQVDVSAENYSGVLTSMASAAVALGVAPAAPTGLAAVSQTHDSITVTGNEAWEYTRDGGATVNAGGHVFTGLAANTAYDIQARVKATATHEASDWCAAVSVTTSRTPAGTAAAPVLESRTDTAITVTPVSGQKYILKLASEAAPVAGDAAWGDTVAFTGLTRNTAYKVYTYIPATGAAEASAVVFTEVTTEKTAITDSLVPVTGLTGKTYDTNSQEPTFGGNLTRDTHYTVTYAVKPGSTGSLLVEEPVGAGTYIVTVSGAGDYTGSFTREFVIAKKAVTVTPVSGQSKVYGDSNPTYAYNVNLLGDLATVFDSVKTSNLNREAGENVGTYTIGLGNLSAGDNFELTLNATPVTFAITRRPVSITAAAVSDKPYDGTDTAAVTSVTIPGADGPLEMGTDFTVVSAAFPDGDADAAKVNVTIQVALAGAAADNYELANGGVYTAAAAARITKAAYTGTKAAAGSARYGTTGTVELSGLKAPGGTLGTPVMADSQNVLFAAPTLSGDTLHFAFANAAANAQKTATVTIPVTGAANYSDYEITVTLTVLDKLAQSSFAFASAALSKTYGDAAFDAPATGAAGGSTLSYSSDDATVASVAADGKVTIHKAGTTTIRAAATATEDYAAASASYELTVAPRPVTVNVAPASRAFGAAEPTFVGTVDAGTPLATGDEYSGLGMSYATAATAASDVGVYDVTGSGTNANYAVTVSGSGKLTITKAAAQTLADISASRKYTVTDAQAAELGNGGMPANAGTLAYAKGTETTTGSVAVSRWSVDENGTVSFTLTGGAANDTVTLPVIIRSTNYADSTVNLVITLTEKDVPTASAADITVAYTGSAVPDAAITGTASVPGTWSFQSAAPTAVAESGSHTVVFTPTDSENYATVEQSITVTIQKAAPTGAPAYTPITAADKTLADAALNMGTLAPAGGVLAWDLGDSHSVAANTAYGWTYTPADTANYDTLSGSITPYVVIITPSYPVAAPAAQNGSVSLSQSMAYAGSRITVTAKPEAGYVLASLTAADGSGKAVALTRNADGTYSFTMPASRVEVKALFQAVAPVVVNPFTDVQEGAYYYEAVLWAVGEGVTQGTSATTFSPEAPCTRAQVVTFLWRAAGCPEPERAASFADVAANSYYAEAVAWAAEQGITVGTGPHTFSPDAVCTRSQIAAFLYRFAGSPAVSGEMPFADVPTGVYYADAVLWAVQEGVTQGTGATTFSPDAICTRAQIVTFLYRYFAK